MKMFTTSETTKGRPCLIFDEYRYICYRIRNTRTYWRCDHAGGCRGRAKQNGDEPPVLTSSHNHDPPKEANDIAKFKTVLKQRIRDEGTSLQQVYRSELVKRYANNPDDVAPLPLFHQLKNTLYRTKNEHYPPLPRSINEVHIEGRWRVSCENENFLILDQHNPRYLTFGTKHSLKMLCESGHIFLDGTFKSCPSPFAQLYSIHAHSPVLNGSVPVLYTLLPNKTKNIYTLFFNEIRNAAIKNDLVLNPRFITVDFEQGAINALKSVFPNASIKGCNFHFNQCVFKKIQELGLQSDYYDSPDDDPKSVKSLVQRTGALAFMPPSKIDELWCIIMDQFQHISRSQDFFDYCTDTWIDDGCLFPRCLWNYYGFDGARTNNSLEGWHHRLNSNVATSTPNIYVVIDELKKDYAYNMASIKQLEYKGIKPLRRKPYVIRNERIHDLMNRYREGSLSLDDYFIKISKTIGKKSR